ncbi:MAG: hypothetical protein DMG07_07020 [Acidobacteria bacterium]|nr:MAG: hypothetical protein DMG07_07020 [Acidobacteriota bacterium]
MLSAKQIPPGQSGQIEVVMQIEAVTGKIEKTVSVVSNDPSTPMVVLNLIAVVEPEFNLSERMIDFGSTPQGKPVVKEIEIRVAQERSVKVLSAESTDAAVTVKFDPVDGPEGHVLKLVATQKADAAEGHHFGNLVVKTSSSHTPELRIPVRGMVTKAGSN